MNLRLIEDWRRAHRFASVRLSGGAALLFGAGPALFDAWRAVPDDLKDALPHGWARWIATGGFLLILAARMVRIEAGAQGGSNGT